MLVSFLSSQSYIIIFILWSCFLLYLNLLHYPYLCFSGFVPLTLPQHLSDIMVGGGNELLGETIPPLTGCLPVNSYCLFSIVCKSSLSHCLFYLYYLFHSFDFSFLFSYSIWVLSMSLEERKNFVVCLFAFLNSALLYWYITGNESVSFLKSRVLCLPSYSVYISVLLFYSILVLVSRGLGSWQFSYDY